MSTNEQPQQPQQQWYSKGFGGLAAEQARMESADGPRWFWMKEKESRHITLVDDEPIGIYMHEYKEGKDFNKHVTCVRGLYNTAPCCDRLNGDETRVFFSLFTIIDLDGYKSAKNGQVKNVLSILACKMKTAKLIEQEKIDETSLIGRRIRLRRLTDKAPKTGDSIKCIDWEFGPEGNKKQVKVLDEYLWTRLAQAVTYRGKKLTDLLEAANQDAAKREQLGKVFDLKPITNPDGSLLTNRIPAFNFLELYKPKPPHDLAQILRGASVSDFDGKPDTTSATDGEASEPRSDDVPF